MILHIARREWLEQIRQPWMLAASAALFLAIAIVVIAALGTLDWVAGHAGMSEQMTAWIGADQDAVGLIVATLVSVANWLIFTQFLGITAVLAGHAILHDRERGTLPFLLLAPIGRIELLAGKVLGAVGPSYALYAVVNGAATAIIALLPVSAAAADRLPPSLAWFIAFFVGAPLWAAFVSTIAAIVSSVATDVRTAQQVVWLVMFFATFLCGFLLAALLPQGAIVELAVAGFGAIATIAALWTGSQLMRRDLGR